MNAEELALSIAELAKNESRFLVAIAGPPGSGKSTLAIALSSELLARGETSRVIQMDGFHLDNSNLSKKGLLSRKGASQTFDADGFIDFISRIATGEDNVAVPAFDRDKDLVVTGAAMVTNEDHILIVEGNYLLIEERPWSNLEPFWNETIFINPGLDVLQERLITRWLEHGLGLEQAQKRALSNDIPNAQYVVENSSLASLQYK